MKPQTELCEKCGKKQSCAGMEGEGWFCMDCFNELLTADGKKAQSLIKQLQDEFEHRRTDRAEK